jgi:hypothetical protein
MILDLLRHILKVTFFPYETVMAWSSQNDIGVDVFLHAAVPICQDSLCNELRNLHNFDRTFRTHLYDRLT